MKARLLDCKDPESWRLMPYFLVRVGMYASTGDDDDPVALINELGQDFISAKPRWFKCAFVGDEGRLVGHILALADGAMHKVWHMKFDVPMTRDERREFDALTFDWAQKMGCTKSESWVENDAQARRLQIYYGYKRDKIRMRKVLQCESTEK